MHAPACAHSQQVEQSWGSTSQLGNDDVVDDAEAPLEPELESAAAVVPPSDVPLPPSSPPHAATMTLPQPNNSHTRARVRIGACYLAPLADSR